MIALTLGWLPLASYSTAHKLKTRNSESALHTFDIPGDTTVSEESKDSAMPVEMNPVTHAPEVTPSDPPPDYCKLHPARN